MKKQLKVLWFMRKSLTFAPCVFHGIRFKVNEDWLS